MISVGRGIASVGPVRHKRLPSFIGCPSVGLVRTGISAGYR